MKHQEWLAITNDDVSAMTSCQLVCGQYNAFVCIGRKGTHHSSGGSAVYLRLRGCSGDNRKFWLPGALGDSIEFLEHEVIQGKGLYTPARCIDGLWHTC